ncbi:tetratricopeptide repeat protein [Helicobacter burdigaliensis]
MRYKRFIFVSFGLLAFFTFVGCFSAKELQSGAKQVKTNTEKSKQKAVLNQLEDVFIFQAYNALDNKDLEGAKEGFKGAFKISSDYKYLKEIVGIMVLQKDYTNAKEVALKYLKKYPKDEDMQQALIGIYSSQKDFKNALGVAKRLIAQSPSAQNFEIVSSVYFLQKDYENAVKFLKKAYHKTYSVELLDRLASIYVLFLNDRQKAVGYYEAHLKMRGYDEGAAKRLAILYLEQKQYKLAAKVYEMSYVKTNKEEYIRAVLQIYFELKDINLAQKFIEKYPNMPKQEEMLLDIYRYQKDHQKAIAMLQKLFAKTGNYDYLAQEAIYLYESGKKDKKSLEIISQKLKTSLKHLDNALYANYLGYLLIDHSLDIKSGINYVQRALKIEPNNIYYLDSLAWGFYKMKDCQNAKEIMEKIPKDERQKEQEIKDHYEVISKCKI